MRVFVTGCQGFIGRHVVMAAAKRGYQVYGIDISRDHESKLPLEKYFKNDSALSMEEAIREARPNLCVHAAGLASVAGSIQDPQKDFFSGPVLTFNLLDQLRKYAIECRTIFLSSASVYGEPHKLPVSECADPRPISPYGFHKLQSELILNEFNKVFGLPTTSVRIFSAYGVGLKRQVLWDMFKQMIDHGTLNLRGTGEETRDFVNIEDISRAVFVVANSANFRGEVYNLASGSEISISNLAKIASKALSSSITPAFDGVVSPGDPKNWCADISKIASLGYSPKVNLEEGVFKFGRWCQGKMV